ncbi:MAG: alanine glycine permease, partial [Gammaproteobacteria bacterium]|nr:alanine glycine permease [Gammaproteobacteria bacterium]
MSDGIDQTIDAAFRPIAETLVDLVFVSIDVNGTELPLIVAWLVIGATFFTGYFRFINIRGFTHAISIVSGRQDSEPKAPGEVSH